MFSAFFVFRKEFYEISKWNWLKSRAGYAHAYVVWNENKIVGIGGITNFWGSPTESILLNIFVLPEFHGQGIGKKLVDSAMSDLEAEGIHKVALVAFEKNLLGNAFWEKIGFTVRDDLVYRNKNIHQLKRIDLI